MTRWRRKIRRGEDGSEVSEESRMVFKENGGYLFSDFWPFIILHFGERQEKPSPLSVLQTSLSTFAESFYGEKCRGYYQGKEACRAWINGLSRESDFRLEDDRENVLRRLNVNDSMLCCLIDARRAAASWLRENISLIPEKGQEYLAKMAENFQRISDTFSDFRNRVQNMAACEITYNTGNAFGVSVPKLRREQIGLLENALSLEEENCRMAELIRNLWEKWG